MRNVHFRFPSATQKRSLHELCNINGNNDKQKGSNGTIRKIMVMTKNNYDNDDDDDLWLNKMYEEYENKIVRLISPANFPTKKKKPTRSRTSCEVVTPTINNRQIRAHKVFTSIQ